MTHRTFSRTTNHRPPMLIDDKTYNDYRFVQTLKRMIADQKGLPVLLDDIRLNERNWLNALRSFASWNSVKHTVVNPSPNWTPYVTKAVV
jgi:hypothetical protein